MTRDEMLAHLRRDGYEGEAPESRLDRADANGTSALGRTRDATEWDVERCDGCAGFHHAFAPRGDGLCGGCGEGADDRQHGPPCATEGR